jgi:hypothetical protein
VRDAVTGGVTGSSHTDKPVRASTLEALSVQLPPPGVADGEDVMADFRLDIVADGGTVALCPVGTLDRDGARVLVDAVHAARGGSAADVDVRLDGVERFTEDGLQELARADLAVTDPARRPAAPGADGFVRAP